MSAGRIVEKAARRYEDGERRVAELTEWGDVTTLKYDTYAGLFAASEALAIATGWMDYTIAEEVLTYPNEEAKEA